MSVHSLLNPRSVAIVGASDKVGPGFNAWNALKQLGFTGDIHLINPGRDELFGQRTYRSLDDICGEVDAAFIAVRAESVLDVLKQATQRGIKGVTILSSGFGDAGPDGLALQRKMSEFAVAHGISVCGPNCLGLLNFSAGTGLFGTSLPETIEKGGVAAVVQSGSIGIALLNSGRHLGLSHLITTGNEAVTTTADYLEVLIDDPAVTTIVVFAEQIRKPDKFMTMARQAKACGKPLIILKSGRSESGRAAVMAHTGAVAGSSEACDAALSANGAIQVHTLDELVETAALASQLPPPPAMGQLAAVSLSGGEIALALDAAEEIGIRFAPVGSAKTAVESLLPAFAHIANPLDLTWAGLYDMDVAKGCATALAAQGDVSTLVLLQDAPSGLGPQQAARYAGLLDAVAAGAKAAGKPLVALSNLSDPPHPALMEAAQRRNVPYLRGTKEGLLAVGRYIQWAKTKPAAAVAIQQTIVDTTRRRLEPFVNDVAPAEHEARYILAAYGIQGPKELFVTDVQAAAEAATDVGFPVVLKCVVPGMIHKSDAGLVKLRLMDTDAVTAAATDMLRQCSDAGYSVAGLLIQRMVPGVAEILVGARVDPDFGPVVVVGAGGINVELYRDVAVRLAPIDEASALDALQSTRIHKTLLGWRGAPRGDLAAVSKAISSLSQFISDFRETVSEVEINPIAVLPQGQGCLALDCVIVTHGSGRSEPEESSTAGLSLN